MKEGEVFLGGEGVFSHFTSTLLRGLFLEHDCHVRIARVCLS